MPETICIDDTDYPKLLSDFLENELLVNGEVFVNGVSVAAVSDYVIDLVALGAGDFTITYTEIIPADANNPACTFTWSEYITIVEAGDPSWTPTTPVCATDMSFCLDPNNPPSPTAPFNWAGPGVIC